MEQIENRIILWTQFHIHQQFQENNWILPFLVETLVQTVSVCVHNKRWSWKKRRIPALIVAIQCRAIGYIENNYYIIKFIINIIKSVYTHHVSCMYTKFWSHANRHNLKALKNPFPKSDNIEDLIISIALSSQIWLANCMSASKREVGRWRIALFSIQYESCLYFVSVCSRAFWN